MWNGYRNDLKTHKSLQLKKMLINCLTDKILIPNLDESVSPLKGREILVPALARPGNKIHLEGDFLEDGQSHVKNKTVSCEAGNKCLSEPEGDLWG